MFDVRWPAGVALELQHYNTCLIIPRSEVVGTGREKKGGGKQYLKCAKIGKYFMS
jgi:hypothetical protein